MVLHHRTLISIERSGVISINSPVRRQVHDASMMKLQVSRMKVTLPYHHDHITSQAPCKIKFRRLYFISCIFYVASRAFAKEPFLTYELRTTTLIK